MAFQFASELNLNYVSQTQYVDLYVDGVYKGSYLLVEAIESGKNRVDINTDCTDSGYNGDFLQDCADDGIPVAIV